MTTGLVRACGFAACVFALSMLLDACSRPVPNTEKEGPKQPVPVSSKVVEHIWRVEQPASGFAGTIYIFVPDGTLLETSCKETYRIAKWAADSSAPDAIQVVEDGQPAFAGTIVDAGAAGMRLQRRLRHGETDELKLSAVAGEFVCPDLR